MMTNPPTTHPSPESLLTTLRSFPRPVWILFVGVFINKFGTFVLPFLTLYLTRRGFSTSDAGLAIGAYGLGRIGAGFIGGQLADSIGRRKTIVLSMVLAAVSMTLLSQAQSLTAIVLLTGLASLTGEMYLPAAAALLIDQVPPERRVTAFSAYRMAFNAGWAFGPAAAAFLAAHSFVWLFIGDALSSVLFAVVAWKWLPGQVCTGQAEAGWKQAWSKMRENGKMLQVVLATLFMGLLIHQMVTTYGLHVTSLGHADATYGALLSLNGLLVVLFELPLTTWTRRLPARPVIAVGYLLMGLGLTINVVGHRLPALVVGMVIFTLGEMTYAPVISAYVASLAPERMRGRYMGTWSLSNSLSLTIAPNLGMMIFARSPIGLWISCGFMAVLGAVTILAKFPSRDPALSGTAATLKNG